jgi:hypothetical protein
VAMTKIIAGILPREVLVRAFTTKTEINLFAEMDLSDAVEFQQAWTLAEKVLGISDNSDMIDVSPTEATDEN